MMVAGFELDEHNLVALLLEGLAGLRAGVVELGRLADDDGAGADYEDLLNAVISCVACRELPHLCLVPFLLNPLLKLAFAHE